MAERWQFLCIHLVTYFFHYINVFCSVACCWLFCRKGGEPSYRVLSGHSGPV